MSMPDFGTPHAKRRLLVLTAVLVVGWVLWHARGALTPFALGAVVAYLLAPIVELVQRAIRLPERYSGLAAAISVLVTYLLVLSVLAVAGFFLVPPLIAQTNEFANNAPSYVTDAQTELDNLNRYYQESVPQVVRVNLENNFDAIKTQLTDTAKAALKVTFNAVGTLIGFIAGLALLPLWLFYVLKDQRKGLLWFYNIWPEAWRDDVRAIVGIVDSMLATYIRVQLFLGVLIGLTTGIVMWLIGIKQALVLGLFAGLFELIPVLGPWLAFVVAAVVTLATDPGRMLLVGLAFLGIQQLENTLLVPKLQGDALRINPAIIVMLLAIGGSLWGLVGLIVIVPLTAVLRDTFLYLYHRIEAEPSDMPDA